MAGRKQAGDTRESSPRPDTMLESPGALLATRKLSRAQPISGFPPSKRMATGSPYIDFSRQDLKKYRGNADQNEDSLETDSVKPLPQSDDRHVQLAPTTVDPENARRLRDEN